MRGYALCWDWKEQLRAAELNTALTAVFDGKNQPYFTEIEFDGDSYAMLVSSGPLNPKAAKKAYWRAYKRDDYLVEIPDKQPRPAKERVS